MRKKKNNVKTNLIAVSKTFPPESIEPLIIQDTLFLEKTKYKKL